jgi:ABC-type arginine/histidine transport system permease subunit
MMFKLLRSGWDEEALRGAFETLDLSQTCRAESLGLERFEALARLLTPSGGDTQRF